MEELGVYFESIFERLRNNGTYAGFFIAAIGLLLLIAVVMDSDWVLEGGNGFFNIATISHMFGRKTARFLMGALAIIIIGVGLSIAYLY